MSWTKEEWKIYLPFLMEEFPKLGMLNNMHRSISEYGELPTQKQRDALRAILAKSPVKLARVEERVRAQQKDKFLSLEMRRKFKESYLPSPEKNKYTLDKVKVTKAEKFDNIFKDL